MDPCFGLENMEGESWCAHFDQNWGKAFTLVPDTKFQLTLNGSVTQFCTEQLGQM